MKELKSRLEKLAYQKTKPFCYSCYKIAPSGTCKFCGSDDLMRHLDGVGVEYGIDWVIKSLIEENITSVDTEEEFKNSISECYPEEVKIGWITVDVASTIKELDPNSWRIAESEWIDSEVEDENLVTFDNGSTHYRVSDIEEYLDENEPKLDSTG